MSKWDEEKDEIPEPEKVRTYVLEASILERVCDSSARHFRFMTGHLPDTIIVKMPSIIKVEVGKESKEIKVVYGKD
jgi:hypothetical protein